MNQGEIDTNYAKTETHSVSGQLVNESKLQTQYVITERKRTDDQTGTNAAENLDSNSPPTDNVMQEHEQFVNIYGSRALEK